MNINYQAEYNKMSKQSIKIRTKVCELILSYMKEHNLHFIRFEENTDIAYVLDYDYSDTGIDCQVYGLFADDKNVQVIAHPYMSLLPDLPKQISDEETANNLWDDNHECCYSVDEVYPSVALDIFNTLLQQEIS